jgi:hypothetical protein
MGIFMIEKIIIIVVSLRVLRIPHIDGLLKIMIIFDDEVILQNEMRISSDHVLLAIMFHLRMNGN